MITLCSNALGLISLATYHMQVLGYVQTLELKNYRSASLFPQEIKRAHFFLDLVNMLLHFSTSVPILSNMLCYIGYMIF